jgi:hypothetical protein
VTDDEIAEELEAGEAVPLPLMALSRIDGALDDAGAVGRDELDGDGGQGPADACGEGVQLELVVGVHALEPAEQVAFSLCGRS